MSQTLLAPHWIPYHREGGDATFFGAWRPRYVKIVCDGLEVPYVPDVPADAAIIVRHFPSSELDGQRGFAGYAAAGARAADLPYAQDASVFYGRSGSGRDLYYYGPYGDRAAARATPQALMTPEDAADLHIERSRQIAERLKGQGYPVERFWFEGLNEPMLWSVEPPEAVARYEARRVKRANQYGLNLAVLNCGVGWPGNGGVANAPVQWDWFKPVLVDWRPNHLLCMHEYCGLNGPQENWKWWMGRFLQCPFQIKIVITECGIDGGVVPGHAGEGWWNLPQPAVRDKAAAYIGQLAWYEAECFKDPRVQGLTIFTYDGNGEHWGHFNIKVSDWQIEFLTWLRGRPELPATEPNPTTFADGLQAACTAHQAIQLNPGAALQKRMLADGFVPTCNEFDYTYGGITYVAQRAERLSDGAVRAYYAPVTDYNAVRWLRLTA